MVSPELQAGGAERQLCYLSRGLKALGHEIIVATLGDRKAPPPEWSSDLRLYRLEGKNNYDPRLYFRLSRLVGETRPDIVQTWNPQTDILGGAAAVLRSPRWLIREALCADVYQSGWKAKLRARLAIKSAAVVANSAVGLKYWRALYPEKPLYMVRNGLSLSSILRVAPVPREQIGIKKNQKFILFAGRLTRQKRVDRILTVFSAICREHDVVISICGEGEEEEKLKKQAQQLEIGEHIRFHGFLQSDHLWSMMKTADLFINLSDYEGMPNTVMEAMACGCPLMVSDIPAHREILDVNTAVLVDLRSTEAQSVALKDILADPATARSRATTAEKRTHFWSIREMAKKYEDMYREILK